MMSKTGPFLLALDQGTTSTRAILFGPDLLPLASAQQELQQYYPAPGWVEHEPEEIWQASVAVLREALARGGATPGQVAGIGIKSRISALSGQQGRIRGCETQKFLKFWQQGKKFSGC